MSRKMRALVASAGVVLALGLFLLVRALATGGDSNPDGGSATQATPSGNSIASGASTGSDPTASSSDAPGAPGTNQAEGVSIPLALRPSSEVPWDDLGEGWFVVSWTELTGSDVETTGATAVTLVSPAGAMYATAVQFTSEYSDAGWMETMTWEPGGVALFQQPPTAIEFPSGAVAVANLATGQRSDLFGGEHVVSWTETALNGNRVGYATEAYESWFVVTTPSGEVVWHCSGIETSSLSPDGRSLVCLESREDGRTDVLLSDAAVDADPIAIDVFKQPPYDYAINGWIDGSVFLLSRPEGDGRAYFRYNIVTHATATAALPFVGPGDDVRVIGQPAVYQVTNGEGLRLYRADGSLVHAVTCTDGGDDSFARVSGEYALVICGANASEGEEIALVLVDLNTGAATELGRSDADAENTSNEILAYPGS